VEITVHDNTDPKAGKGERTVGEWKQLLAFPSVNTGTLTILFTPVISIVAVNELPLARY